MTNQLSGGGTFQAEGTRGTKALGGVTPEEHGGTSVIAAE